MKNFIFSFTCQLRIGVMAHGGGRERAISEKIVAVVAVHVKHSTLHLQLSSPFHSLIANDIIYL